MEKEEDEDFEAFEDERGICPACGGAMDYDAGVYFCDACDIAYIRWRCFYDCIGGYDGIDRMVVQSFLRH